MAGAFGDDSVCQKAAQAALFVVVVVVVVVAVAVAIVTERSLLIVIYA
jgi:hypothetical protein